MASVTMNIHLDSALKEQAELVLRQLGLTMDEAVQRFLRGMITDPFLSETPTFLSTPETLDEDLRRAEEDRKNGAFCLPIEDYLEELDRIIEEA